MQIENDFFEFNYLVKYKKKFQNSQYLFEIYINFLLLCAHPLMTSIILHPPRPNC